MRFCTLNPLLQFDYWNGKTPEPKPYGFGLIQYLKPEENAIYLGINSGDEIMNFDKRMMRFEKFINMKKLNKCRVYCHDDFVIIQNEIAVSNSGEFCLKQCRFSSDKKGLYIDGLLDRWRGFNYRSPRITFHDKFRYKGKIVEQANKVAFQNGNIYIDE